MTAKHTPGPWSRKGNTVCKCNEVGPQRHIAALREVEKTFRWYGDLHAAKPDMEKAARNYEKAAAIATILSRIDGEVA